MERIFSKKAICTVSVSDAKKHIDKKSADNGIEPVCINPEYDRNVDLSIIVPIYNYVDYVDTNVKSVLKQKTKYNFQVILVDDGSTDGAGDVVDKYKDVPNVLVIHQKNQGIAGARNTGLNSAVGKYIMFVDCDDVLEDSCVELLMNRAYSEDCDIVMGAHNLVKEQNGVVKQIVPNVYPEYNLASYCGNAKILNYAGLPWAKVYKRSLWENVRYFPGYWYEDSVIHALIFTQCKKFAYESQVCYQYKWYGNNFSNTQGNKTNYRSIDRFRIIEKIIQKSEQLDIEKNECYETMLLKHLSGYYYPTISGLDDETITAMFVLACDLYQRYSSHKNYRLNYMLRKTRKALEQRDINLWKAASKCQK